MSAPQFSDFLGLKYADQAIAFLNAYWLEVEGSAESVWEYTLKFEELDIENKKEGSSLDEFNAHRFLESVGETKRVVELREQLKESNIKFNKRISFIEYLLFKFSKTISDFVSRPQGDNSAEIEKAQALLRSVQEALDNASARAAEAKKAADNARQRAQEATEAADAQKAALDEVLAQEDAYKKRTEELTKKSEDESIGLVSRNRAKNELAQHLSQDNLPLNRARLTLEAATKKADKARLIAEEAKAEAEDKEAQAAKALEEAEKKVEEATAFLEETKAKSGGNGQGSIWWLERELMEKKKYMPKKKGGNW